MTTITTISAPRASLTVPQVADRLNVSEKTVRRWLRAGMIRGIKLPGREERLRQWRISAEELQRLQEGM